MANIKYRISSSDANIPGTTSVKAEPLTNVEVDGNFRSIQVSLTTKAPIDSPTFTGTPAAPTATAGTNTTQVATTAFVSSAVSTVSGSNITSGTVGVQYGGTGGTTFTAGSYLKGNGTSAFTAQAGIPAGDITSGTLGVARGGTGVATLTGIVKGNGTSAFSAAVAGTDYLASISASNNTTSASYFPVFATTQGTSVTLGTNAGYTFNPGTGVLAATDFNSTSDASLKENVSPLNGLDLIRNIFPVQFNWKSTGKKSYGVIAQELEQNFPELVEEREDGIKGVSYIPIIAMLVDAVQKLEARVVELKNNK
jgi:hypothetical protein